MIKDTVERLSKRTTVLGEVLLVSCSLVIFGEYSTFWMLAPVAFIASMWVFKKFTLRSRVVVGLSWPLVALIVALWVVFYEVLPRDKG